VQFTDSAIRYFPVPSKGHSYFWDEKLRGFGVRVSRTGTRTFLILIGSGRRQTLGRYPLLSLADARAEAKRLLAEKTLGRVRPTHVAFEDAKADFLAECATRTKPRTLRDYTRLLGRHYPFGRKSVAGITTHDIASALKKLSHVPSERHHAFTAARAFFRYCVREHIIETNPIDRIQVLPPNRSRERVLTPEELAKTLRLALSGTMPYDAIVSLLAISGQRRSEIAALEWAWIHHNECTITLPSRITKNKREHTFPVGQLTLSLLSRIPRHVDCPYVFPAAKIVSEKTTVFNGWGKTKARFDKDLNIAPWRLHDLRRTLRTEWAKLRISKEIAERYINHISGENSGVNAIYDRYKYMPEMREAVENWEQYLQTLIAQGQPERCNAPLRECLQ
jgi:integrase